MIDGAGLDPAAELTFVATPVLAVADAVKEALGGHHRPGHRRRQREGRRSSRPSTTPASSAATRWPAPSRTASTEPTPSMFEGAVWVLTPTAATTDAVFAAVASVVSSLGAEVVALPPDRHDALVAVVSHVPHLAAAALMSLADQRAEEHAALLRLAAGGFRDMTRIASGHPAIWPDICAENRDAIVEALDGLIAELTSLRGIVAADDREALLTTLVAGPRGPRQPAVAGRCGPRTWPRCASPSRTAPAPRPRCSRWPPSSA